LADDLLPEIFTNLIGNAVKYGGAGVEVMLTVEDIGNDTLLVTVADTGPGVPDDDKEAIFHRFERGRAAKGSASSSAGPSWNVTAEGYGSMTGYPVVPNAGQRSGSRCRKP
jgi:signal transduction histidine kinase